MGLNKKKTALVLKLPVEIIISIWLWNLKIGQISLRWLFSSYLFYLSVLFFRLLLGECWLELVLCAGDARWVFLDRLMKTVTSKMSQNNHLQSNSWKPQNFLAGCLSHSLMWQSRLVLVHYLLVRTINLVFVFLFIVAIIHCRTVCNFYWVKSPLIRLIIYSKELKHVDDLNQTLVGLHAILVDRKFVANETDFV